MKKIRCLHLDDYIIDEIRSKKNHRTSFLRIIRNRSFQNHHGKRRSKKSAVTPKSTEVDPAENRREDPIKAHELTNRNLKTDNKKSKWKNAIC